MMYRLIRTVALMMAHIPLPISQFLGKMAGTVFAMIPLQRTAISLEQIEQSFPDSYTKKDAKKLNRKVLRHFGQMFFEIPHIMRLSADNQHKYLEYVGEENVLRAIRKGKGIFFLTGHFGNWELMCAAVSLRFGNAVAIVRQIDFPPLDRFVNELRSKFGTEIILKQYAMRKIMAAIRKKKRVGVLLDQNMDWYEGVFVPFLGKRACTSKGLALMALKTGAPVIPVFALRRKDGRYRVIFDNEVELTRTGDKTRDVEENTANFTRVLERVVRDYPDQWFWFHRRWKTLPYCQLPDSFYPAPRPE